MAATTDSFRYPESLQMLLETEIMGNRNVYYQPPSNVSMKYPCIVYQLQGIDTNYACNQDYISYKYYQLTYIDNEPNTLIPDKLNALPMCSFVRTFTSENRNHYVFRIYWKERRESTE